MDELGNKALELIEKAEATAPHVWTVLIRQAHVAAYVTIAQSLAWLMLAVVAAWILKRLYERIDDEDGRIGIVIVGSLSGIAFLGIFGSVMGGVVEVLLNPEYQAFHLLLLNLR